MAYKLELLQTLAEQNDKNLEQILSSQQIQKTILGLGVALSHSFTIDILRLRDGISKYFSEKLFSLTSLPTIYERFKSFLETNGDCVITFAEKHLPDDEFRQIFPEEAAKSLQTSYTRLTKLVRDRLTPELIIEVHEADSIDQISETNFMLHAADSIDKLEAMIRKDFRAFLASVIPGLSGIVRRSAMFMEMLSKVAEAGLSSSFGLAVSALYVNPHLFLLMVLGAEKA